MPSLRPCLLWIFLETSVHLCYSRCDPWTSSMGVTWDASESEAPPQTRGTTHTFSGSQGDLWAPVLLSGTLESP